MKLNAFLIYTYSLFSRNDNLVLRYDSSDEIYPKKLNILFYMSPKMAKVTELYQK